VSEFYMPTFRNVGI